MTKDNREKLAPYSPSSASRALVDAAAEADRRFKCANDVYANALTERRKAARVRNAAYNELFSADYDDLSSADYGAQENN